MGKNDFVTTYSAIWKNGPLYYSNQHNIYARDLNKKITLKYLHNSQNITDEVLNKASIYSKIFKIYGISQHPNTNDIIFVLNNITRTSGNKKTDDFIQEVQLGYGIIFEWIPYYQFDKINELNKNDFMTVYSAIWKDGPLYKKNRLDNYYTRDSNKEVALKCLYNSQDSIELVINKAKKYLEKFNRKIFKPYGISQNPDTNDYILVLKNIAWISGNKKIDDFIEEMQLKIHNDNIVFEWIPYYQLDKINEINKNDLMTVYSAIWKDGPLYYDDYNYYHNYYEYTRYSNKEVALKCLHNSQDLIELVINEAKKYLEEFNRKIFKPYGISQNPDTNDYILVLVIFEWIPYYQLDKINEINKNDLMTVYSATWKDGPLYCDYDNYEYTRYSNKEVALKCLHNSHDSIELVINEAKKYLKEFNRKAFKPYGISQNPDTKDYILVLNDIIWISGNKKIDDFIQEMQSNIKEYAIWKDGPMYQCTRDSNTKVTLKCLHSSQDPIELVINEISGNKKIDDFIQEMQSNIKEDDDIVFEWIPYNQLDNISEINKNDFMTVYSAIWKDGPLYFNCNNLKYTRDSCKEVALKCLHNSQDLIEFVINEVQHFYKYS
ncbi:unnamed protein product [Rhizophagus irregularis]|nr:unnamed protein product [Rhizophagus irregularis]